ncbi:MAG: hypothetical protein PW788_04335 [Micavibrio sp.]|nr:hypothetical protein [Micavibrio sp.]
MPEKQVKKAANYWHEGTVPLVDLTEIAKGIKYLTRHHPNLKAALQRIGKLQWRQQPAGFEGLVCIILGQQVSVAAATAMRAKLVDKIGAITPRKLLKLDDDDLRACGFSRQKMIYARDLAERVVARTFNFADLDDMNDEDAMAALVALKGIGVWSAEIYLMFCLGRPDVWPAGDLGIQQGLQRLLKLKEKPDAAKTRQLGEIFAPHRSAASLIVWRA